jgi:hypothetical protein
MLHWYAHAATKVVAVVVSFLYHIDIATNCRKLGNYTVIDLHRKLKTPNSQCMPDTTTGDDTTW